MNKKLFALVLALFAVGATGLSYAAGHWTGNWFAEEQRTGSGPSVDVFKSATCGCCAKWVDHMKQAGFRMTVTDMPKESLDNVKTKHKIPAAVHSCHTAVVDGYVIEGHVPASEVKRLLKEKTKVAGIAVPGMPLGSPGMEVSGVTPQPYDVVSFDAQGQTRVFATIKP